MKTGKILLVVSLVIVLVCSFIASQVQSGFGAIDVQDIRINAEDGSTVSALLYVPKGVDAQNKAPAVVTCEGYLNSREMQTCFSIEYARRGYVVLAIDMYGHGRSSTEVADIGAVVPAVQYVQKLDYVDTANIGLEGHSKGGLASTLAAATLPGAVKSVLAVGSGLQWPVWYGVNWDADTPINYGTIFGKFDEFGWLFWPESHTEHTNVSAYGGYSELMQNAWGTTEPVEPSKWYGDKAANTQRIFYQPAETHPANHISTVSTGYAMDFMNQTLEGGNKAGLANDNQIWFWKEICTAIAMVGAFLFMFALGTVLVGNREKNIVSIPEAKGRMSVRFWVLLCVGTAIPALTYKAFMTLGGESSFPLSRLFPMELANQTAVWAVLNGIISLALFLLMYFLLGKKEGASAADWGLKAKPSTALRQVLLGIIVAVAAYVLLCLVDLLFKVDFRLWVVGFMPLTLAKFGSFATYLIFFVVFAFCNALVLNATYRFKGQVCYGKTALFSILGNIGGLLVMLLFGYGSLLFGGSIPYAGTDWSLLLIVAIPFLVTLTMAALLNTYFYKKTGTIYMGATISALFLTFAVVGNTCFQFLF